MSRHPAIAYLDGHRLRLALQVGVHQLLSRQQHLNKINVFPVADGDTGTNLSLTLHAMLGGLRARPERHAGRALARVADAGLDGARGNSGAIMAQFFQGLSDAAAAHARLSPDHFAVAAHAGASYAREALSEPREGTLLSVLSAFAEAVRQQAARRRADFITLLDDALQQSEIALARTPDQLAVLRKAGVVDAGAEGFVELLRGMRDFLSEGEARRPPAATIAGLDGEAAHAHEGDEAQATHRYCTECVVLGEDMDPRKLREALTDEGDSLVIAGARHKLKVHLHTNQPDRAFNIAAGFGEVHGQKADDMWQQQRDVSNRSRKVAIVTDSAADIPDKLIDELGIHVIPVHVRFGEASYLDKLSMSWEDFYRRLDEDPNHPATSQPAPGEFRRIYQMLASHYDSIISIHVTAAASGTWQSAVSAARRLEDADIHVVDSRSVSAGLGQLVMAAAEKAGEGADARAVLEHMEAHRDRTRVWGAVADLSFGVRGGRVSPAKQKIVDALHLTPVLTARRNGKVDAGGVLFGQSRTVERFTGFVARRARKGRHYRLLVGHCNAAEEGQALLDALRQRIPEVDALPLVPVGPALGAHAGPGTLVASLQERDVDDPRTP
ncbi:DegV family protein [Natronospira bacteriovora]|uniref:DegV family protein n=1 Tax=Natronospira bacteriovora TaxID=3069753 RepID=A0ABU0WAS6_9GAMM|nr:DegV family protein [Natronospira sp. AB-CW4]MDQ2070873.1 DegV family protein [Natronospira sp. AB-CW4]